MQVSPRVKAVLATEEHLADGVKFCTDPEEFGIWGTDVTYNIGDFYITMTAYQQLAPISWQENTKLSWSDDASYGRKASHIPLISEYKRE